MQGGASEGRPSAPGGPDRAAGLAALTRSARDRPVGEGGGPDGRPRVRGREPHLRRVPYPDRRRCPGARTDASACLSSVTGPPALNAARWGRYPIGNALASSSPCSGPRSRSSCTGRPRSSAAPPGSVSRSWGGRCAAVWTGSSRPSPSPRSPARAASRAGQSGWASRCTDSGQRRPDRSESRSGERNGPVPPARRDRASRVRRGRGGSPDPHFRTPESNRARRRGPAGLCVPARGLGPPGPALPILPLEGPGEPSPRLGDGSLPTVPRRIRTSDPRRAPPRPEHQPGTSPRQRAEPIVEADLPMASHRLRPPAVGREEPDRVPAPDPSPIRVLEILVHDLRPGAADDAATVPFGLVARVVRGVVRTPTVDEGERCVELDADLVAAPIRAGGRTGRADHAGPSATRYLRVRPGTGPAVPFGDPGRPRRRRDLPSRFSSRPGPAAAPGAEGRDRTLTG